MTKDEALKLALEALEDWCCGFPDLIQDMDTQAITAIKETLAQPEPWEKFCDSNCVWTDHHPNCKLSQRTWVGMTDEEIKTIEEMALTKRMAIEMAIAIVKEKNT